MRVNFNQILNDVTQLLNKKLPKYLYYHSTAHTLYVLDKAIYIAQKEKVSEEDLNLVKLAALYHDVGFIRTHIEHEKIGCEIAQKQLTNYGLAKDKIKIICGMIMATKIPQNPKTHLEQIIADADLEYLATNNFESIGELLFQEFKYFNKDLTREQWIKLQIKFVSQHRYHTKYCKHYKSFRKIKNLEVLKNKI